MLKDIHVICNQHKCLYLVIKLIVVLEKCLQIFTDIFACMYNGINILFKLKFLHLLNGYIYAFIFSSLILLICLICIYYLGFMLINKVLMILNYMLLCMDLNFNLVYLI